jgi:NAD(P)-dependent dehydrogenase (short-subunit alcohol dehydrogenase family)
LDNKLIRKKAVIVTGVSSDIGKAISIKLVELGFQVLGLARSYNKLVTQFSSAFEGLSKVNAKENKSGKNPTLPFLTFLIFQEQKMMNHPMCEL